MLRRIQNRLQAIARRLMRAALNRPVLFWLFRWAARRFPGFQIRVKQWLWSEQPISEQWIDLDFPGFRLRFFSAPLADRRGIGRVARSLLAELQHEQQRMGAPADRPDGSRPSVHFYAAVQWCPAVLPPQSVVMIHDLTPLVLSDVFDRVDQYQWHQRFIPIVRQAWRLVSVSPSSARDIARLLDRPPQTIHVVPNGVDAIASNRNTHDPAAEPYLVYLGAYDHHKNLEVVFQALREPSLAQMRLMLIGENQVYLRRARKMGLAHRVVACGRLSDEALAEVLGGALALVFPSLYEGFGLPPFEAAQLGVPSICSERPAMNELLSGAAMFVDPHEPDQWAQAIVRLRDDRPFRDQLGQRARATAAAFSWQASARNLIQYCEQQLSVE